MKDLGLWALPRLEVEHTQEPEEQEKTQKSTDLGYSKKKTAEEKEKEKAKEKAIEEVGKLLRDHNPFDKLGWVVLPSKKKTKYNKVKIIKALLKKK